MTKDYPIPSDFLQRCPSFSRIFFSDLNVFKVHLREKDFEKNEMLSFAGELCEHIFIVQFGRVKISRSTSSGREQILEVLNPGDTCACNPGSAAWSCPYFAQALTDTRVWNIPRANYVRLVQENLSLSRALNHLLAKRICRLGTLIELR